MTITLFTIIFLTLGIKAYPYRQAISAWWHERIQEVMNPMDSLLNKRLQATHRWLATAGETHYSIQILEIRADRTEDLVQFLHKPTLQPLLAQLYVYQIQVKEKKVWRVLYGEFGDKDSAHKAIAILPSDLQRNQPFLRMIKYLQ
jgi:septal ring-binding cell division protein DamX